MKIQVISYAESESDIRYIRDTVFGEEQKIPRELDWDGNDRYSIHVVATDGEDNPIGTGRIRPDGRIGRLAVLKQWRCQGVGAGMLEVLIESVRTSGLQKVYLHAQVEAITFYEKHGFEKDGEEFIEAGIRHIRMMRYTNYRRL